MLPNFEKCKRLKYPFFLKNNTLHFSILGQKLNIITLRGFNLIRNHSVLNFWTFKTIFSGIVLLAFFENKNNATF